MKKLFLSMISLLAVAPAMAQETYESAPLVNEDLNGTARYVGMGGAMEALGADISTMSSNPAGIGLMRHSTVSGSASIVMLSGDDVLDASKTKASFDQLGFVLAMQTGKKSFMNFGVNYHKSKNFNQILSAAAALDGASQNKLTYNKYNEGLFDLSLNGNNLYIGNTEAFTEVDYLHANTSLLNTSGESDQLQYSDGTDYTFGQASKGYISEYDFNLSGNANNRFFWGVTVGVHDVHYKSENNYIEYYTDGASSDLYSKRQVTGTGVDVKAGIIFRPVNNSPFRVGLYVHTPTWYNLDMANYADIVTNTMVADGENMSVSEGYEFEMTTPWKFGVSLGHTVGKEWAFGVTYEYSDYSTTKFRVKDGDWYGGGYYYDDWYGDYYYDDYYGSSSYKDVAMNENVKQVLKGVSTIKLGVEYKPMPELALRLGYNYQSPNYKTSGYKDGSIESPGTYYTTSTAYTNWLSTNRITAGVGYKAKKWNFDLAYQYSQTNGEFYPFMSYTNSDSSLDCVADMVKVSNKRSQIIGTIGYTF